MPEDVLCKHCGHEKSLHTFTFNDPRCLVFVCGCTNFAAVENQSNPKKWAQNIGYVAILDELPVGTRYKMCASGGLTEVGADYVGHYAKVIVFVVEWPDGSKPMGETTGGNDD